MTDQTHMEQHSYDEPRWAIQAGMAIIFFIVVGINTAMGILLWDGLGVFFNATPEDASGGVIEDISFGGYVLKIFVTFIFALILTTLAAWFVRWQLRRAARYQ